MIENEFVLRALHSFNHRRSIEKIPAEEIEHVDREFILIHGFIENLLENKDIPSSEKNEKLMSFLNNIKANKEENIKNKELIRLTLLVCQDLGAS